MSVRMSYIKNRSKCKYRKCEDREIKAGNEVVIHRYVYDNTFITRTYHAECYIKFITDKVRGWFERFPPPEVKETSEEKGGRPKVYQDMDREKYKRYRALEQLKRYHAKKGHEDRARAVELQQIEIMKELRPLTAEEQILALGIDKSL